MTASDASEASEREPLLPIEPVQRTPLPFQQLLSLLFLRFCDAVALCSTFPYQTELLTTLAGGDSGKVAYYVGIMETVRHSVSVATIMPISRWSDYIGRKPIILIGTATIGISSILFGTSKTFVALVLSRCLYNALNHNGGATKSAIGEMTDETNRADAFALYHVPWTIGAAIGPLIGGTLANPHTRFPELFGGKLWEIFPYLLPSAVVFIITLVGFIAFFAIFRETLPTRTSNNTSTPPPKPVPIRHLLTPRVALAIANNVAFVLCHMSFTAIQPLFLSMSISSGGLSLSPLQIGYILSAHGFANAFVQTFFLAPVIRRTSLRAVFRYAVFAFAPIFLLFPLMNIYARDSITQSNPGSHAIVWVLLFLQLAILCTAEFGLGCIYIYINSSAPNNQSLGSVNGLTHTAISLSRLVGPAFATTLVGLSINKNWLNGYAVYLVLSLMACGFAKFAGRLPKDGWVRDPDES